MTIMESQLSADEKVRVVLQVLNPQASMAEMRREHNLVIRTVYGWKEKLLASGRIQLAGPDTPRQAKRHKKEAVSFKRIIG